MHDGAPRADHHHPRHPPTPLSAPPPHTQDRIRNDIIEWLKYLKTVGFDGWRFDFVRGYGGQFVKAYIDATVPELAFGEYW